MSPRWVSLHEVLEDSEKELTEHQAGATDRRTEREPAPPAQTEEPPEAESPPELGIRLR